MTGSPANGLQDQRSNIGLFLGVVEDVELETVLVDCGGCVSSESAVLHHFDVKVPATIYRTFLLLSCLEVDLGFTPASQLGLRGQHFRAVLGEVTRRP